MASRRFVVFTSRFRSLDVDAVVDVVFVPIVRRTADAVRGDDPSAELVRERELGVPADRERPAGVGALTVSVNVVATSAIFPVWSPMPSRRTGDAVACTGPCATPVPHLGEHGAVAVRRPRASRRGRTTVA